MVWEGGLRVPFIIAGPDCNPGVYFYVRVSAMDLLPTFTILHKSDLTDPQVKRRIEICPLPIRFFTMINQN